MEPHEVANEWSKAIVDANCGDSPFTDVVTLGLKGGINA